MSTPEIDMSSYAELSSEEVSLDRNLLEDMTAAYMFCGSVGVYGGVADSFDKLSSHMRRIENMQTHAIVGSSPDKYMERQVLPNFTPSSVHPLSSWNVSGNFNGSKNPIGTIVRPFKVSETLKEVAPDIMSVMLPMMPHVGGRAVRYALKHDIPVIGTYHIDSNDRRTNQAVSIANKLDGRSLANMSAMVAVSPVAENHLRKFYKYKNDVHVIPNPVDIDFYAKAKPDEAFMEKFGHLFEDGSKKTILFVGRPDERKGLGELIDSAALLHTTKPDLEFQLIVCGDGPELQNYKDKVNNTGISNLTHFTGNIEEPELAMMQSQSDVMALLATGGESQGIVVLKAFAGKVPTVFGNNAGYASIAGHLHSSEPGGAMVDPKNTAEVAEALSTILEFDTTARRIQKEQQSVLGKYALSTVGTQHAELYRQIIGISVPYRTDRGLI